MLRPKLLLFRRAVVGLAPLLVRELFEIMRTVNQRERVSILLVEQNAAMALDLANRAYLIETGRVVLSGPPTRSNATTRAAFVYSDTRRKDRGRVHPSGFSRGSPRRHLCQSRARTGDDLSGDALVNFAQGEIGDVLDLHRPGA